MITRRAVRACTDYAPGHTERLRSLVVVSPVAQVRRHAHMIGNARVASERVVRVHIKLFRQLRRRHDLLDGIIDIVRDVLDHQRQQPIPVSLATHHPPKRKTATLNKQHSVKACPNAQTTRKGNIVEGVGLAAAAAAATTKGQRRSCNLDAPRTSNLPTSAACAPGPTRTVT